MFNTKTAVEKHIGVMHAINNDKSGKANSLGAADDKDCMCPACVRIRANGLKPQPHKIMHHDASQTTKTINKIITQDDKVSL